MFKDFKLIAGRPVSIQVKDYMKHLIIKSALQGGQKLPSTRELSTLLKVSRNSVISAYEGLEDDGFAYTVQGQGSYVAQGAAAQNGAEASPWTLDWTERLSSQALLAEELDIMKRGYARRRARFLLPASPRMSVSSIWTMCAERFWSVCP